MIFSFHSTAPLQRLLGLARPESEWVQGANVSNLSNIAIFCLLTFSWSSLHVYGVKEFLCAFRNQGGEISAKGQNPENGGS